MVQRIENAIRIKQSTNFYEIEAILRELPSNIFLKDAECRYVFATHYWHHLKMDEGDPNWDIRGKTDLEIRKDLDNAMHAYESDKEILRTGKGTEYMIEINTDGVQEFLELIKRPVFDEDGNATGIIALANDVTEAELAKRELEKHARTDELTGLANHRAFDEALQELPGRCDLPISIISVDCDYLKQINDTYGHLVGDEYIRMAATAFRAALPHRAQAFRTGGDEFVALVPQTTRERAEEAVADMRSRCGLFKLRDHSVSISCGLSIIESPDENPFDAIARADRSMYEDKASRRRG
ncbi:MAG TPA: sensor domain-containing diguanylate cyclase [Eggerthellaceae bacterium]|nr:sensor domain-containing diguanylate cyclase [Eggerthellaceae bacterium]